MLSHLVKTYYGDAYDYNCAEATLKAANDCFGLGLGQETFKAMAAFGGGMGTERVCGAISASMVVLSMLFVREQAHESEVIKQMAGALYQRFMERLGTDQCHELKEEYRTEEARCLQVLQLSVVVLEEIIWENREMLCHNLKWEGEKTLGL